MLLLADDLAALGAQYREARAAVIQHRRRQAAAELRLHRLLKANRGRPDTDEITVARADVARAHEDVRWCQAVTIAAAEQFKGVPLDQVAHDRTVGADVRRRALAALED